MKLYQSRYIPSSDPWEPNFFGVFIPIESVPCFLYKERQKICLLSQTGDISTTIHAELGNSLLPLPKKWSTLEYNGRSLLMVKPDIIIDLRQAKQLPQISESLQRMCIALIRPEMYYLEHQFVFGEYCISHRGQCGYRCTKAGKTIWDFNGKAYLYTDIFRWNNRVFFGTAGYGGYFYILDIETGKSLASIKTGGTACIVQIDHLCFVSSKSSRKNASKLLCVDLHDGRIVNEIELYGGVTKDSKLQIIGSQLHVVTFEYRGERCLNAIWNVVDK